MVGCLFLTFCELLNDIRTEKETLRMAHDYVATKECQTVGGPKETELKMKIILTETRH